MLLGEQTWSNDCVTLPKVIMNVNGSNGCFSVFLSKSGLTAIPPDRPICSMIQEQTGGIRLQVRHRSGDGGCPKADII